MAAVHILIFGEMAGFKIVPYLAKHMKKYVISKYAYEKILHTFIQGKYMRAISEYIT